MPISNVPKNTALLKILENGTCNLPGRLTDHTTKIDSIILPTNQNYPSHTGLKEVWVDGSKTKQDISIAIYYKDEAPENTTFRISNAPYPSSYLAELLAILYTLRANHHTQDLCIYSDSKSVLSTISNKRSKSRKHKDVLDEVKWHIYKREAFKSTTEFKHVYSHLPKCPKRAKDIAKYRKMIHVFGFKWESIRLGNEQADKMTQETNITVDWPWSFGPKHRKWTIKRNSDLASSVPAKFSKDSYHNAWKKHYPHKPFPSPNPIVKSLMQKPEYSLSKRQNLLFKVTTGKLLTNERIHSPTLKSWLTRKSNSYRTKHSSNLCPLGCQTPETISHFMSCPRNPIPISSLTSQILNDLKVLFCPDSSLVMEILLNSCEESVFTDLKLQNKRLKLSTVKKRILFLTIDYLCVILCSLNYDPFQGQI